MLTPPEIDTLFWRNKNVQDAINGLRGGRLAEEDKAIKRYLDAIEEGKSKEEAEEE